MSCFRWTSAERGGWLLALAFLSPVLDAAPVKVQEEDIVLPTYLSGEPEPNPVFYFGRNSQGAEGRVYPYPLYDSLTDVKTNKCYRIIYLENEYVRIGVLPEIGGDCSRRWTKATVTIGFIASTPSNRR